MPARLSRPRAAAAGLAATVLLAGCTQRGPQTASVDSANHSAAARAWAGCWTLETSDERFDIAAGSSFVIRLDTTPVPPGAPGARMAHIVSSGTPLPVRDPALYWTPMTAQDSLLLFWPNTNSLIWYLSVRQDSLIGRQAISGDLSDTEIPIGPATGMRVPCDGTPEP